MARWNPISDEEDTFVDQINMTPLIDVVFVVLISFILIAPLLKMEKVDLAKASATQSQFTQESLLSVTLKKDLSLWINQQKVSFSELKTVLSNIANKSSLQLHLDQRVPFGEYKKLKDMIEEEGFEEMQLIVKDG